LATLTAILSIQPQWAQAKPELAPVYTPSSSISFAPVATLKQQPAADVQLQLRHGVPGASKDWQASFYTTFTGPDGITHACTAALVGPGALLTAAHCIPKDAGASVAIQRMPFEPASVTGHAGHCVISDTYDTDHSTDWALCSIDPQIIAPASFRYERVQLVPMPSFVTPKHMPVILGGYGCTSDVVDASSGPPTYNIGSNAIVETSQATTRTYDGQYYAPRQQANLFTDPWDGANLCPGDSGGPAFRITSAADGPYVHRVIVGINTNAFWRDDTHAEWAGSMLSSLGAGDFGTWAASWADTNHQTVCGVWPQALPAYCR
jgi:hypothetical protein